MAYLTTHFLFSIFHVLVAVLISDFCRVEIQTLKKKCRPFEEKVQDFYFSTDNERTQNTRNSIVSLKKLEQLSVKKSRNPCRRSWPKRGTH